MKQQRMNNEWAFFFLPVCIVAFHVSVWERQIVNHSCFIMGQITQTTKQKQSERSYLVCHMSAPCQIPMLPTSSSLERKRRKVTSETRNEADDIAKVDETSKGNSTIFPHQFLQLAQECAKTNNPTPTDLCSMITSQIINPVDKNVPHLSSLVEFSKTQTQILRQVFAALKTLQELRDEVHYFNMNQHEDDQRDILLRLIQIQAIIRMKLYSVFSSTQELQSLFLSTYNAEFFKTGTQEKKKKKQFTIANFITELCSFLELAHFILPQEMSFRDFVMCTVCQPFPELSTTIVLDITAFFEFFPSDHSEDEVDSIMESHSHTKSMKTKASSDEKVGKLNPSLMRIQSKQQDIKDRPFPSSNQDIQQQQTKVEHVKTEEAVPEKSVSVNSIPLIAQSNLRNRLISRQKYVGNHFSDNVSSLFQEVKMAPRPATAVATVNQDIQKKRVVQETPIKGNVQLGKSRSPARSKRIEEIRSPCIAGSKDPSKYVAAVMKFRSKPK